MSEELVPGPAELVAAEAVVVLVTADPDLVLELGHGTVVCELLPVRAGVDHPGVRGFLYQLPICTKNVTLDQHAVLERKLNLGAH